MELSQSSIVQLFQGSRLGFILHIALSNEQVYKCFMLNVQGSMLYEEAEI